MIDRSVVDRIVRASTWAPSGDNSQPWSFRIEGDDIFVSAYPERDHPIFNVEARGTYLAIGALLENMMIAARTEGCDADLLLLEGDAPCARLSLRQPGTRDAGLAQAIPARHTHRGPYALDLPPEAEAALAAVVPEAPCGIVIIRDRATIQAIAASSSLMEETALQTEKLHAAFFSSIMWDPARNARGESGLYIGTTELPPPIQLLFRLMRYWPFMRILNRIGFPKIAASGNTAVYVQSGACVAVTLPSASRAGIIATGRTMQRLWLTATTHGLAAQPLAGLLYLAEYLSRTDDPDFDPVLKKRVAEARADIATAAGVAPGQVAILLRVGVPLKPATARSARRNPEMK